VYQTVFEDLASNGYIVVSIGHQDESAMLIKEDGSVTENTSNNEFYTRRLSELNGREINNAQDIILNSNNEEEVTKAYKKLIELTPLHTRSIQLWQSDTNEVIEILLRLNKENVQLKNAFNFDRIGIFGHSVGGATAGQLAGNNQSIKAAINIDGFQFGNLINTNLKAPFMFISSNEEGDRYLRVTPFAFNSEQDTYHLVVTGFSHDSFSDLQLFSPNGSNNIKLQRIIILTFFNKYLKDQKQNLMELENNFSNIKISKY